MNETPQLIYSMMSLLTLDPIRQIIETAAVAELDGMYTYLRHMIEVWRAAWEQHPDFEWSEGLAATRPENPIICGVWTHDPGHGGITESYIVSTLDDLCTDQCQAWGKKNLGDFAHIRPIPPWFERMNPYRREIMAFSYKGRGKKYRAKEELKRLLPTKFNATINRAAKWATYPKWHWLRRWWEETRGADSWRDFHHMIAEHYGDRMAVIYHRRDEFPQVPPWYYDQSKYELAAPYFRASYGEKFGNIEVYISIEDLMTCASGQIHPDRIKQYVVRQQRLPLF